MGLKYTSGEKVHFLRKSVDHQVVIVFKELGCTNRLDGTESGLRHFEKQIDQKGTGATEGSLMLNSIFLQTGMQIHADLFNVKWVELIIEPR